ncbi:MAG: FeoB-associated Cys-rich membrane protein [Desulfomonile tiedjei]|nr:FeoB-associated Cys-rich membrane protein [Desulfomonile tiedjei]
MWQEIIVGLLVIAAALFIGKRFWKNFKGAGTPGSDCGCGCSGCSQGGEPNAECQPDRARAGSK